MNTISALEDKVARAHADVYNLQQEYNGFVRRSKADGVARREEGIAAVIETLLPVLDDAELARQHGDLEGPAGQIVEKIEQTLAVNYKVERFGAEGDDFDPQIHEALMHQTSPDVESEKVNVLIQPGYRIGDKLLRPARVGVVSPE
ncbi:nucleotide exchange factor GrpE [Arcanobacterium haemolyticum]|nr:nucleotide exchange factor GrpE [Arcanobacterium haemolyticum]